MKDETIDILEELLNLRPPKVDPTMKDHSNDPTVIKRTEEARKRLEKVKFPPEWDIKFKD